MVFHVGINLVNFNKAEIICKSEKGKIIEFNVAKEKGIGNNNAFANFMFQHIKSHLNGKLGCACIFIDSNYNNEERKSLLQDGLKAGFKKCSLLTDPSATLLNVISNRSFEKISKNTVIGIIEGKYCHVWQINDKEEKYVYGDRLFIILKEKSAALDRIYFEATEKFDKEIINKRFPDCIILTYKREDKKHSALIKAQSLAKFSNICNVLSESITVTLNEKIILKIDSGLNLPITKFIKIQFEPKEMNVNELVIQCLSRINEKDTIIKASNNFLFKFLIDTNNIYTFEYYDLSMYAANDITEISDHELDENYFTTQIQFNESYNFPEERQSINNTIGINLGTTTWNFATDKNQISGAVKFLTFDFDNQNFTKDKIESFQNPEIQLFNGDSKTIMPSKDLPFDIKYVKNKLKILVQSSRGKNSMYPEEITAVLLKRIKEKAEESHGKQLDEAVITIPANFNQEQKQATHVAALLAGWKTIYFLPEPVAAAFAYFSENSIPENSVSLLFDFGGGTLDVCIFEVQKNVLKIISKCGDPNLGGRDFDNLLMEYFIQKLQNDHGVADLGDKRCKLMVECQNIKHTLTVQNEATLDVSDFELGIDGFINITRNDFEKMAANLIQKIDQIIDIALKEAKYISHKIIEVLYVGGSCRMPMIKTLLRCKFSEAEHCCQLHPDEVVAIGAAHYFYSSNKFFEENQEDYNIPEKFFENDTKINAVGIDLGTSNCFLAINGRRDIKTVDLDNQGQRGFPSYVSFREEKEICGHLAVTQLRNFAKYTVFDVKRLIGKKLKNIAIDPTWPFYLEECDVSNIQDIDDRDFKVFDTTNPIIQFVGKNNQILSNSEAMSLIFLKNVSEIVNLRQGDVKSQNLVIAVPSLYNKIQLDAMKNAAKIFGWNNIYLLPETIAAAYTYFIKRGIPTKSNILSINLGHNTMEIAFYKILNNKIQSIKIGFCGDNFGGNEFDKVLEDYFKNALRSFFGVTISNDQEHLLRQECQAIKHVLSKEKEAFLKVNKFDPSLNIRFYISRREFKLAAEKQLNYIDNCIRYSFDGTVCSMNEIDKVLQVGGGCHMPIIKKLLRKLFPEASHCSEEFPERVTAAGAAAYFQCYQLLHMRTPMKKNHDVDKNCDLKKLVIYSL